MINISTLVDSIAWCKDVDEHLALSLVEAQHSRLFAEKPVSASKLPDHLTSLAVATSLDIKQCFTYLHALNTDDCIYIMDVPTLKYMRTYAFILGELGINCTNSPISPCLAVETLLMLGRIVLNYAGNYLCWIAGTTFYESAYNILWINRRNDASCVHATMARKTVQLFSATSPCSSVYLGANIIPLYRSALTSFADEKLHISAKILGRTYDLCEEKIRLELSRNAVVAAADDNWDLCELVDNIPVANISPLAFQRSVQVAAMRISEYENDMFNRWLLCNDERTTTAQFDVLGLVRWHAYYIVKQTGGRFIGLVASHRREMVLLAKSIYVSEFGESPRVLGELVSSGILNYVPHPVSCPICTNPSEDLVVLPQCPSDVASFFGRNIPM